MTRHHPDFRFPAPAPFTFLDWFLVSVAGIIVTMCLLAILFVAMLIHPAHARWKPEYANASQATQDWYKTRMLTEAAKLRFNFKSCCDNSDVVKTKFKVGGAGNDEWFWFDKEGEWKRVPPDVIHWNEHAPDGQAVMFALGQQPTCFYPPDPGI